VEYYCGLFVREKAQTQAEHTADFGGSVFHRKIGGKGGGGKDKQRRKL